MGLANNTNSVCVCGGGGIWLWQMSCDDDNELYMGGSLAVGCSAANTRQMCWRALRY